MYVITKWCEPITDSGSDEEVGVKTQDLIHEFRLLDGDGIIYAYGYSDDCNGDTAFDPVDDYAPVYGCTQIQYKNPKTGEWEPL